MRTCLLILSLLILGDTLARHPLPNIFRDITTRQMPLGYSWRSDPSVGLRGTVDPKLGGEIVRYLGLKRVKASTYGNMGSCIVQVSVTDAGRATRALQAANKGFPFEFVDPETMRTEQHVALHPITQLILDDRFPDDISKTIEKMGVSLKRIPLPERSSRLSLRLELLEDYCGTESDGEVGVPFRVVLGRDAPPKTLGEIVSEQILWSEYGVVIVDVGPGVETERSAARTKALEGLVFRSPTLSKCASEFVHDLRSLRHPAVAGHGRRS